MNWRAVAVLLLTLAAPTMAAGDEAPPPSYQELPPGRYTVGVRGMLCTVCARAVAAEWAKIPEVEKAAVDFNKDQGIITVRLDKTLQVNAIYKGLRRAERLANMGGRYDLRQIKYIP